MRTHIHVVLRTFVAGCGAFALAACSTAPSEPGPMTKPSDQGVYTDLIEAAHATDPGGPQEQALRSAEAAAGMTFDALNALKYDMFDCFDEAGVQYEDLPPYEASPGLPAIDYSFYTPQGDDADAFLALADTCQERYLVYAQEAYHRSPIAVDAQEARRSQEAPLIRRCLEARDVKVEERASYDELIELSIESTGADELAGIDRVPCPVEAGRDLDG